jgi:hypothetical protein
LKTQFWRDRTDHMGIYAFLSTPERRIRLTAFG